MLRREVTLDSVDRLHEAPAIAGLHRRDALERSEHRLPRRDPSASQRLGAEVARDQQLRGRLVR